MKKILLALTFLYLAAVLTHLSLAQRAQAWGTLIIDKNHRVALSATHVDINKLYTARCSLITRIKPTEGYIHAFIWDTPHTAQINSEHLAFEFKRIPAQYNEEMGYYNVGLTLVGENLTKKGALYTLHCQIDPD